MVQIALEMPVFGFCFIHHYLFFSRAVLRNPRCRLRPPKRHGKPSPFPLQGRKQVLLPSHPRPRRLLRLPRRRRGRQNRPGLERRRPPTGLLPRVACLRRRLSAPSRSARRRRKPIRRSGLRIMLWIMKHRSWSISVQTETAPASSSGIEKLGINDVKVVDYQTRETAPTFYANISTVVDGDLTGDLTKETIVTIFQAGPGTGDLYGGPIYSMAVFVIGCRDRKYQTLLTWDGFWDNDVPSRLIGASGIVSFRDLNADGIGILSWLRETSFPRRGTHRCTTLLWSGTVRSFEICFQPENRP